MWTKNFIRNDPREDTPHRNQRDTLLVPKGGNCALEKTHGAGKIEIEGSMRPGDHAPQDTARIGSE